MPSTSARVALVAPPVRRRFSVRRTAAILIITHLGAPRAVTPAFPASPEGPDLICVMYPTWQLGSGKRRALFPFGLSESIGRKCTGVRPLIGRSDPTANKPPRTPPSAHEPLRIDDLSII